MEGLKNLKSFPFQKKSSGKKKKYHAFTASDCARRRVVK
jgi:hypothetical protein